MLLFSSFNHVFTGPSIQLAADFGLISALLPFALFD
jgi:hypothetical protein